MNPLQFSTTTGANHRPPLSVSVSQMPPCPSPPHPQHTGRKTPTQVRVITMHMINSTAGGTSIAYSTQRFLGPYTFWITILVIRDMWPGACILGLPHSHPSSPIPLLILSNAPLICEYFQQQKRSWRWGQQYRQAGLGHRHLHPEMKTQLQTLCPLPATNHCSLMPLSSAVLISM